MKEVIRKLFKNKGGNGGYTYRVSIPVDFIRELDLEKDSNVSLVLKDGSIIISKIERND